MKILSSLTESEKETIDLHLEDLKTEIYDFYDDIQNNEYVIANEGLFRMKRTLNDIGKIIQRTTKKRKYL